MSVTTQRHYSAFVAILSSTYRVAGTRLRCNATPHPYCACVWRAYQMRTASKSPEVATETEQFICIGYSHLIGCWRRTSSLCLDVEPNSIKSLINLWEYNFLFWWTDCTPKLIVRGLSWETGTAKPIVSTNFTRLFF